MTSNNTSPNSECNNPYNQPNKHPNNTPSLPTITAIATPIGRGGVGVIRISGDKAYQIACKLTKHPLTSSHQEKNKTKTFKPRHAHFCRFYSAEGVLIDEGIVLYFPAPHSFTGEDVIEIQGHGGMVLQNLLLSRIYELGAKQATAGEFSFRAFDNDKLDLVQAEAIADAIDATSEASALSAMRSLTGEFSTLINELLEKLINLRLYVEASIDFPDEEDVDFLSDGVIESKLDTINHDLTNILATAKQGQLLRDGIHVVIAGRPNAGKSSLLNRLAGQERAIVTEIAGTTRDTLQETIVLNGLTIHLTDTAGLRDTTDTVEKIGIERARQAIEQADILLMVHDLADSYQQHQACGETPFDLAKQLFGELPRPEKLLIIGNKLDLLERQTVPAIFQGADFQSLEKNKGKQTGVEQQQQSEQNVSCETVSTAQEYSRYCQVNVSCETADGNSQGIDKLISTLCEKVDYHPPENALIARTRHIDALKRTQSHLQDAHEQLTVFQAGELVAESLRLAQANLGEITGEFTADDLLGKIFGSFCIGK